MFALQPILTEIKVLLQNLEPHEVSVAVDLSSFTFTEVGTNPRLRPQFTRIIFSSLWSKRSCLESLEHSLAGYHCLTFPPSFAIAEILSLLFDPSD